MVLRRGAVVVGVLGLLGAGLIPPAGADDHPQVPTDEVSMLGFNLLFGVHAVSSGEAHAVGVGGSLRTRAKQWDGTDWTASSPPGDYFSELYDVEGVGRQVWASGVDSGEGMVLRWNRERERWAQLPAPPREVSDGHFLRAIAGTGPDDVWTGGYLDDDGDWTPLLFHWDGTTWTRHELPLPYGNDGGFLYDLVAIAPDDVWAVGRSVGTRDAALLAHWDGTTWTDHAADIVGAGDSTVSLRGVDASPDGKELWATGIAASDPAVLRWDGTRWHLESIFQSEDPTDYNLLEDLTVLASDDIWVVGGYGRSRAETARIGHWDGRTWTDVRPPRIGREHFLLAVSGSGPDDVWAVGGIEARDGSGDPRHLYLHHDGTRWTRVKPGDVG